MPGRRCALLFGLIDAKAHQRVGLFTQEFEAPLSLHGVGKSRVLWYHVLFMPAPLARMLPLSTHPRLRVRGEIVDIPVSGAWMPTGDGRHYFIVSPSVRKVTAAKVGGILDMRFVVDDQNRVDIPCGLAEALAARPELLAIWLELTPGRRRGYAHRVAQAKSLGTLQRRIDSVLTALAATRR